MKANSSILRNHELVCTSSMERTTREFHQEPTLRIAVAEGQKHLDFSVNGPFTVQDDQGQNIMEKISSDRKWRVKLESYDPPQFVYALQTLITQNRNDAQRLMQKYLKDGYEARMQAIGNPVSFNGDLVSNNTHFRVLVGEFNSAEDAFSYGWPLFKKYDVEVVREMLREPRGQLEVFDAEYERSARVLNGITLRSSISGANATLWNGHHTCHRSIFDSSHALPLQFCIGTNGTIKAICELPIETYIKGVLLQEMGRNYPLEALKSQAVASRGLALARIGLSHPQDPFDLCSEDHCLLFNGYFNTNPVIERAVEETRGEVLVYNNVLCETLYTPLCGGHTEDQYVSETKPKAPYIRAIVDGPASIQKPKSLLDERNVSRWVSSSPDVYCNPELQLCLNNVDHKHKTFRWEVSYTRQKLEEIIRRKTGEDIGTLFDIIPIKRGSSGRLTEIEILGSRKNIRIRKEYNIRRALSPHTLNSSCFVVDVDLGDDGIPLNLSFIGAGSGHGVGMCQAGATVMALEGKTYRDILSYYYKNSELQRIY